MADVDLEMFRFQRLANERRRFVMIFHHEYSHAITVPENPPFDEKNSSVLAVPAISANKSRAAPK
jgi:hypothetical protein